MTLVFPKNNLPESAQPWAREIQKQLSNIVISSTTDEVNNAARDSQLASSVLTVTAIVNEAKIIATTANDAATAASDAAAAAQSAANEAQAAINGLLGLGDSSGSDYTVNANNINLGAITASSLQLTSADYEIRVGTTAERAYMACSIDAPNGLGFNEIGFAAAASNNRSGWISNCFPRYANSNSLGADGKRWNEIFCTNATINTSDARLKKDIQDSALGLDFINSLRPVSYKWISGGEELLRDENYNIIRDENDEPTIIQKPGVRPHWGFIAQEVKEAIDATGVEDFAGFVLENPLDAESLMSLRYQEFIAPMVKAIQELSGKVTQLESQING